MSDNEKSATTSTTNQLTKKEMKAILKENSSKIRNENIKSFVCLKDVNKIYPNGIQAVYDFNIDINEHEFIVLVGPSGCGKSTTLRMIAGLEDITSGYLYINKVLSNYLASKDRDISMVFQSYALYPQMTVYDNIAFPLKVRKYDKIKKDEVLLGVSEVTKAIENPELLAEAFNEAKEKNLNYTNLAGYLSVKLHISEYGAGLLTKHPIKKASEMTAELKQQIVSELDSLKQNELTKLQAANQTVNENFEILENGQVIHYMAKLTKEEIRNKVFEASSILDLGPYLDRRPKELSGGQMQRVALGRAIVRNAKLFLMDEPLSNLDAKLRVQMRSEIVRIHERIGATTIYVTHDQTEAMTMATRIAVMSKGWVQQIGVPQEIYGHPKNIFVATFIGSPAMNVFDGTYNNGLIYLSNGYQIPVNQSFIDQHNAFYKAKIADCERMLQEDNFKKLHALAIFQGILDYDAELNKTHDLKSKITSLFKSKQAKAVTPVVKTESTFDFNKAFADFKEVANTLTGDDAKRIQELIAIIDNKDSKPLAIAKAKHEIKGLLLTIDSISTSDLAKLHNAQAFNKDKKQQGDTLFYQKNAHHKKENKHNLLHVKNSHIVFTNNLYNIVTGLLSKYQAALIGPHPIRVGVRPEFIHLDNEFAGNKTKSFTCTSDVVELMGSELLLHTSFAGIDMIGKISTGTLVKPHTNIELVFDDDKILFFDPNSGDTINY